MGISYRKVNHLYSDKTESTQGLGGGGYAAISVLIKSNQT